MNIWKIPRGGGKAEQITAGQGDDLEPDVSADGSRIVFATHRQSLGFARLDLTAKSGPDNPRQLDIDLARNQIGPAHSPDGTRLAYFSNLKGVEMESIWVAGADGTNPVAIVQDGLVNIFPKWSPDGEHLIYLTPSEYRRVSVSGGAPTTLLADSGDYKFDVGPDGRLLFRDDQGRIKSFEPGSPSAQELAVSSLSQRGWLLRWSPDGRSIAYNIRPNREMDSDAGLWVEDLHAKPRQVFAGWVTWYARGPGNQIYLQEGKPDLRGVLWRVGWDGKGLTRLSTLPLVHSYWAAAKGLLQNHVDISPDGRHVIFASQNVMQANIGVIENNGADRP
jgi:Tol biopolymer transport system component